MSDFVELAAEAIDHVTDRYFDTGYDYATKKFNKKSTDTRDNSADIPTRPDYQQNPNERRDSRPVSAVGPTTLSPSPATPAPLNSRTLASSSPPAGPGAQRRYKNQLPSPERDRDPPVTNSTSPDSRRDSRRPSSLERQSETSERVLRAYENEPDDPSRRVESVLPDYPRRRKDSNRNRDRDMSYANGYGGDNTNYAPSRPRSQQPARSRQYDDDEGSDYDERSGRHHRSGSGRGYDDDRDRDYDREIIETERYRGPARPYDARRLDSNDENYASGTMAPYRRSQNDLTEVSRRSLSRGRRDRYDDRDRSYSRSRSRSREGLKGIDRLFDKSGQGIGVGIAGAVVGGLAGRHFGGAKHEKRDMVIGALIGGLGANAAENRYREWKEDRREKGREERYEERYDGRARSSVR